MIVALLIVPASITLSTAAGAGSDELGDTAAVRVQSRDCGVKRSGTAIPLGDGHYVTAGHVVAGSRTVRLTANGRDSHRSRVLALDPARDVALLHTRRLDLPALASRTAVIGETVTAIGYPSRSQQATDLTITDIALGEGTDLYGLSPTKRLVLIATPKLDAGYSGAPLLAPDGHVVGMAIATTPGTTYALTADELDAAVRHLHEAAKHDSPPRRCPASVRQHAD